MSGMESDERACRTCCVVCVTRHPYLLFNSDGLSFYKVMTGDFTSFLEFPWKFAGEMQDGLCKNALFIGLNGRSWPIKLCVNNGLANFRNGWDSFVSDNCLNDGDIVVFRHVTRTDFIVQMFRANGYEKQCAKEEIDPSEVSNHGEKSCACLEIIHVEEESSEDDMIITAGEEQDTELELAYNPALKNLAEPDFALEMGPGVSGLRPLRTEKKGKLRKVEKAQNTSCERRKNYLKKVQETQNALTRTKNKSSSKRFAAEVSKQSVTENPNFVKLMTESSVTGGYRFIEIQSQTLVTSFIYPLYSIAGDCYHSKSIPRDFGRQWLQEHYDVVLYSDELSDTWVMKIQSQSHFYGFTAQWRDFVEAHNLKENDACVFELVDKKRCILKVQVLKWEDFKRPKLLKM